MAIARVALMIILTASTMVVLTVLAITLLEWIQARITARRLLKHAERRGANARERSRQ